MEGTTKELIQEFYASFQVARTDLSARLDKLKDQPSPSSEDVALLVQDVAKLRKELVDATAYLPSYDQRQYEQTVKALEKTLDELRAASTQKPKFSFKRSQKPKTNTSPVIPQAAPATREAVALSALSLSAMSHQYLTWASLPASPGPTSDLSLSNLEHCIVNLLPEAAGTAAPCIFTALHIRNVTNTILILPIVDGSALIHDMVNCVMVLGCHQFRMHTSSQTDVYLSIDSNPIIEHCSDIRFAEYPPKLLEYGGATVSRATSKYLSVQDFSHIRATPSPNWSALPAENAPDGEDWPLKNGGFVAPLLSRLLPSNKSA